MTEMTVLKRNGQHQPFNARNITLRLERLLEGLVQQMLGAAIPALPEFRAAHADDRDLVLDTSCHDVSSRRAQPAGVAFQK